jgi:hypothetical protein
LEIPQMTQGCWYVEGENGDGLSSFSAGIHGFQRWSCRREWATVYRMNHDQTAESVEGDLKKIQRVGRGRRDLILVAALVAMGLLIGTVWLGFRGSHVSQSAEAMTVPSTRAGANVVARPSKP